MKNFKFFTTTEPHKILKPAQTRWLSLEQCVVRLIEQWAALEMYFKEAAEKSRLVAACIIHTALTNPIVKLYYSFLKFVLPKFTHFNKLFQSETPNVHFLSSYLASTYKAFLSCYLSSTYIWSRSLDLIDPESKENFLSLVLMSMGEEVANYLAKPRNLQMREEQRELRAFLENVELYYIEAAKQIKNVFQLVMKFWNAYQSSILTPLLSHACKKVPQYYPRR